MSETGSVSGAGKTPEAQPPPPPSTGAAQAKHNATSSGGIVSRLKRIEQELLAALKAGDLTLQQMKKLTSEVSTLSTWISKLQKGQINTPEARNDLIKDLQGLYSGLKGMGKAGMTIWDSLKGALEQTFKGCPAIAMYLPGLTAFLNNPDTTSQKDINEILEAVGMLNNGVKDGFTWARDAVGALGNAIDGASSGVQSMSNKLANSIQNLQNMVGQIAQAEGQVESKMFDALKQMIQLLGQSL